MVGALLTSLIVTEEYGGLCRMVGALLTSLIVTEEYGGLCRMVGALLTSLIVTEEYRGLCPSNFCHNYKPLRAETLHEYDHSQAK